MPEKLAISPKGLFLIQEFEAFSAQPYLCPANKLTIGYGHVLSPADKHSVAYRDGITPEQATQLLRADCGIAETIINAMAAGKGSLNGGFSLNQNQFDALVALVFNIGAGAFKSSTLLKCLQSGDKAGAAAQFMAWDKITIGGKKQPCDGLTNRRSRERALFEAANV